MIKVLIADDDVDICYLLSDFLRSNNMQVETAFNGASALEKLKKVNYDVVLCDFRLPDSDGFEMTEKIKAINPAIQVIIITGYSDVKVAVKVMKLGVFEYVTKPIYPEEILHSIKQAMEKKGVSSKTPASSTPDKFEFVQGEDQRSEQLMNLVKLVGPTDMTCLICGESGTGKEYVAKKLHYASPRKQQPFVALDCGAIPADLASSELFGHVKGSFTGAVGNKKGHFELANGGTLFLDEIGNLSYDNQMKLLRVLQERVIKRVGGAKDIPVDVRIIAATNENLELATRKGAFREDLYHRINEFKLEITPLRYRKADIEIFAKHFMQKANAQLNRNIKGFSPEAMNKLKQHQWPGNLRELQNVVKRAILMAETDWVELQNLPAELGEEVLHEANTDGFDENTLDLKVLVGRTETRAIRKALNMSNHNKSKTAELLGVDRKTLYNKLKQYNIPH
ncbi:response regulator [bacterium]|nr:response regulator [bacterium]